MIRHALALAIAVALVPPARAQSCSGGQTFLKNDLLPADSATPTHPDVIVALCEGEAAGAVFDVPGHAPMVKLKSAAIGFMQAGGVGGSSATVNLKIYDGITWAGGIPTFGQQVFDFAAVTGGPIGVTGSMINTVDLSAFNIPVSSGKLVMTWWMVSNTSGTCASGFPANFATDSPNDGCQNLQRNLIFLTNRLPGENGWHDASTATSFTTPLCPNFHAGNWLMRGCIEPAAPNGSFCAGDGSLPTACPCSNYGGNGLGCQNSRGTGGAYLSATGNTVPDTLVLTSAGGLPSTLNVFWQANSELTTGALYGDGLRCIRGGAKRLYMKPAVGGIARAPTGAEPSITARSAALNDPIVPGSTRYYQVAYRDGNPSFCPVPTGSSFNVSSGMKITW